MAYLRVNQVQNTSGTPILKSSGGIIQVVQHKFTAPYWEDDAPNSSYRRIPYLQAQIKPRSSSSKVLVMVNFRANTSGPWNRVEWRLYKNGSVISTTLGTAYSSGGSATGKVFYPNAQGHGMARHHLVQYLDSPATTNITEYGVYITDGNNDGGVFSINHGRSGIAGEGDTAVASSITLLEISV